MKKLLLAISLLVLVFQPSLAKKKNPLVKVDTFKYVSTNDYSNMLSRDFQYEGAKYWEDRLLLEENRLSSRGYQSHPEYVPLLQNAVAKGLQEAKYKVVGHDSSDSEIKMFVGGEVTDISTHLGYWVYSNAEISVVLDICSDVPGGISEKMLISTSGHGATRGKAINSCIKSLEKKVKKVFRHRKI